MKRRVLNLLAILAILGGSALIVLIVVNRSLPLPPFQALLPPGPVPCTDSVCGDGCGSLGGGGKCYCPPPYDLDSTKCQHCVGKGEYCYNSEQCCAEEGLVCNMMTKKCENAPVPQKCSDNTCGDGCGAGCYCPPGGVSATQCSACTGLGASCNSDPECCGGYCWGTPKQCSNAPPPSEICDNGMDDDTDAKADCADSDCDGQSCDSAKPTWTCRGGMCKPPPAASEDCSTAMDDDEDGLLNCADAADCPENAACKTSTGQSGTCKGGSCVLPPPPPPKFVECTAACALKGGTRTYMWETRNCGTMCVSGLKTCPTSGCSKGDAGYQCQKSAVNCTPPGGSSP